MVKNNYKITIGASFLGFITQAIMLNFPPLLYIFFQEDFGLSLSQMYSSSYMLHKSSQEYGIYLGLTERADILAMSYKQISDALFAIKARNLEKLYYDFIQNKEKNPLIDHLQPNIDLHTISEVRGQIDEIAKSRK